MLLLGLFAFFTTGVVVVSFFQKKRVTILLSIIFGLFFCLQLSSVYFGSSFIDYRYYLHFNKETLSMISAFKAEFLLCTAIVIALPFLISYCSKALNRLLNRLRPKAMILTKLLLLSLSVWILIYPRESMFRKASEIFTVTITGHSKGDVNAKYFTPKERLQATAVSKKNIVIISVESFEKAFLLPPNQYLTPNLQRRISDWHMYDMTLTAGANWTAGSLYAVFTGIPAYFTGHGNNYFNGASGCRLISMADILNHCGYDTYHFSNNADFAGTRMLLKSLGIKNICDGTYGGKYMECPMGGTYDKDIFNEAKKIVGEERDNPFMVFIATTQTHRPNGFVDQRMLEYISPQKTVLETAAISTDWLIEDFINYLKEKDILKNTVVYIFPDHDFWGDKPLLDRTGDRHNLWLLTNADGLTIDPDKLYQIDLPKIILQGAEIKHNNVFFTDIINNEEDKNKFIKDNLKDITALNSFLLERENTIGYNLTVKVKKGNIICCVDNKIIFEGEISSIKDRHLIIPLSKTLKYQSPRTYTDKELSDDFYELCDTYIDIRYDKPNIILHWVRDNALTYTTYHSHKISLDSEMIHNILDNISAGTNYINTQDPECKGQIIADKSDLFNGSVLDYLPSVMSDSGKLLLISAFDSADGHFDKIRPMLHKLGLKEDLSGKTRHAYMAVLTKDSVYMEKEAYSVLHRKININGNAISMTSCGFDHADNASSSIIINGSEYLTPHRGLNIVIYDMNTKEAEDVFYVDTYDDATLTVKRY